MTKNSQASQRRQKSAKFKTALKWLWLLMTIVAAVTTIVAANSGRINPEDNTFPSMLAMSFPFLIVINVVLGLINLFICKPVAIVQWVALICSIPAINNWFPVNLSSHESYQYDEENSLRFMSYNTLGFYDNEGVYPDSTNRSASAIIQSNADIICLQEVGWLTDMPTRCFTDVQIDSINTIYPYFASLEEKMVSILSKYPLKEISLDQPVSPQSGWQVAEITIGNDTILIVSVHLQSFGLNEDDKIIYHQITDGNVSGNMADAGMIIYNKLTDAFKLRAKQAQMLRHQLDSLNYDNVIISGDFNDIAGSYPIREMSGNQMKSAFHEIATGPVITYHKDRFLFNIDHILYQGNMTPVNFRRGGIKSSDHYPLFVTFKLDDKEQ